MADAGDIKARALLDSTDFISALQDLGKQIQSGVETASSQFEKFSAVIEGVGTAVAALAEAFAALDFAKKALDASLAFQKLQASLEAMLGPGEDAKKLFESLDQLQFHSLDSLEQNLGPAAQSLLQVGVDATQTGKTIQALADNAAALKKSPDYINQVADSLASLNAKGIVTTRGMTELEKEGTGAWEALANSMGGNMDAAYAKVKAGLEDAGTLTALITAQMEKNHAGAADAASETWRGALDQIDKQGTLAMKTLGDTIDQMFKDSGLGAGLEVIVGWVKQLIDWFTNLPGPVKDALATFVLVTPVLLGIAGAVGAVVALWPVLVAAITPAVAAFALIPIAVGLVIAGLVALGKWVHDNWQPIVDVLTKAWDDLKNVWTTIWNGIVTWVSGQIDQLLAKFPFIPEAIAKVNKAFTDMQTWIQGIWTSIVGWITQKIDAITKAISGFADSIAKWTGLDKVTQAEEGEVKSLTQTWKDSQAVLAAHNKTVQDAIDASNKKTAADKASADQQLKNLGLAAAQAAAAKQKAEADKQAAAAAKAAATEEQQYAEGVRKGYEAMMAISPEAAKQIADDMGGISDNATKTATTFGKAWQYMSDADKALADSVAKMGEDFKALGIAGSGPLSAGLQKAEQAYADLAKTGKGSAADLANAAQAIIDKNKAIADYNNKELKQSWTDGLITADAYYQGIVNNANQTLTDTTAAEQKGLKTHLDVVSAQQEADAALLAQRQNTVKELSAAFSGLGITNQQAIKTQEAAWAQFAGTITKSFGDGSREADAANAAFLNKVRADLQSAGKDFTAEAIANLDALNQKVHDETPEVEQLANAYKQLGLQTPDALNAALQKTAQSVQDLNDQQNKSAEQLGLLEQAQKKLNTAMQAEADLRNGPLKDAYNDLFTKTGPDLTKLYQDLLKSDTDYYNSLAALADQGEATAAEVDAAWKVMTTDQQNLAKNMQETYNNAFASVGAKTTGQLEDLADTAKKNFDIISNSGEASALDIAKAQKASLDAIKAEHEKGIADWTSAEQAQLNHDETVIAQSTKKQVDVYQAMYTEIATAADKFFGDVTKALVDRLFNDPNKALEQQITDAKTALAQQPTHLQTATAKEASDEAAATATYQQNLQKESDSLAASLAQRQSDYQTFVKQTQANIDQITQAEAAGLQTDLQAAAAALAKQQSDYATFKSTAIAAIDAINQKAAQSAQQQQESYQQSLDAQLQDYNDFLRDQATAQQRTHEDTATNISDQTDATSKNIRDATTDYNRFNEDTQEQIDELTAADAAGNKQQIADLETSLQRKQEDYNTYVSDQNDALNQYIAAQNEAQTRADQDYQTALDDKTTAYNTFLSQAADANTQAQAAITTQQAADVKAQQDSLDQQTAALNTYVAGYQDSLDQINASHQADLDSQVAAQNQALADQTTAYNAAVAQDQATSAANVVQLTSDYNAATQALKDSLKTQSDAYAQAVTDTNTKIASIQGQFQSIWDTIGTVGLKALDDLGAKLVEIAGKDIMGALLGQTSSLSGLWTQLGKDISNVLGLSKQAAAAAGPAASAPAAGTPAAGGAPSAAGAATSSLGTVFSAITAISTAVSAISGIVGDVQTLHTQSILDSIEHNTRYSMLYLGGEATDGGILSVLYAINDEIAWGYNTKAVEDLRNKFDAWTIAIYPVHVATLEACNNIGASIVNSNTLLGELVQTTSDISSLLQSSSSQALTINVSPQGLTTADAARELGNRIAANMAQQMVKVT